MVCWDVGVTTITTRSICEKRLSVLSVPLGKTSHSSLERQRDGYLFKAQATEPWDMADVEKRKKLSFVSQADDSPWRGATLLAFSELRGKILRQWGRRSGSGIAKQ